MTTVTLTSPMNPNNLSTLASGIDALPRVTPVTASRLNPLRPRGGPPGL